MTISELTKEVIADYLRLDSANLSESEIKEIEMMKSAAISYTTSYTGLTVYDINQCNDLTIAVCVLIQDMYDNRTYYVDGGNVNRVVENILSMHSVNLL